MAKKKSKRTSKKKRRSAGKPKKRLISTRIKWLFSLVLVFSLVFYVYFLDQRIRSEFEGKLWNLPARVFAQATEIYLGQVFTIADLKQELLNLGYIESNYLSHPGRFKALSNNSIDITTRNFEFWDGIEPQRSLRILTSAGKIASITDLKTKEELAIIRFEPQLIGKIYPKHNEDRVLVTLETIPKSLVNALIAVEDRNFYEHHGIDPKGIARAIITNIRYASFKQGGSTLTQQLIKNYFLTQEKTLKRKFNEFIMALLLEYHYSKDEILAAYLNEVYLGQNGARSIHGFGTAAEFYFAKPISELNDAEVALLVALVKGASFYNPRKHPKRAIERRNLVLTEMHTQGYLNQKQFLAEKKRWLGISKQQPDWTGGQYVSFLDLLKQQLHEFYTEEQLRTEGLRIFTTLVPKYQKLAQQSVSKRLSQLETAYGIEKQSLQSGLILTTTDTGEVLAVIGSRNPKEFGFNRAVEARRPIGSLIKPAIYLTALANQKKFNALSLLNDSPVSLKQPNGDVWQPNNYDKKVRGPVPMYEALAKSYNLATINLGMELGLGTIVSTLKKLGIEKKISQYPSLLLGAVDLSVLDVTQMYQTLASNGFRVPLNSIRAVMDKDGTVLKRKQIRVSSSLDDKAVHITQSLLTQVFYTGTAASLSNRFKHKFPLAGKTGTTNDLRDSWFAGYGSNLLSVVWVGRDDNQPANLTGAKGAMQIWADIMSQLPIEKLSLKAPEGIIYKQIKTKQQDCLEKLRFPFIKKTIPHASNFCD